MPSHCARAVLHALLLPALGALADEAGEAYSLLDPNTLCSTYLLPDVPSAADCFERAMPFVSLNGTLSLEVPGLPFKGCVYNTEANMVFFGTGKGGIATGTFRYLCVGIATTVTETATTASTVETTTTTQTVVPYTMLDPDTSCATFLLPEVTDEEECFGTAATAVFPGGKRTYAIPGMPFYGCVYMAGADVVLFNVYGDGSRGATSPNLQQICRGIPTTTTRTATTRTTTETRTETTSTSLSRYSLLALGTTCAGPASSVQSQAECFGDAARSVDLGAKQALVLTGQGTFGGCVYSAALGYVMWNGDGPTDVAPSYVQPICRAGADGGASSTTDTTTYVLV